MKRFADYGFLSLRRGNYRSDTEEREITCINMLA
jgi:hypothetical protein